MKKQLKYIYIKFLSLVKIYLKDCWTLSSLLICDSLDLVLHLSLAYCSVKTVVVYNTNLSWAIFSLIGMTFLIILYIFLLSICMQMFLIHKAYYFFYPGDFIHTVVSQSPTTHFIIHARKALLSGLSPAENRKVPPLKYV